MPDHPASGVHEGTIGVSRARVDSFFESFVFSGTGTGTGTGREDAGGIAIAMASPLGSLWRRHLSAAPILPLSDWERLNEAASSYRRLSHGNLTDWPSRIMNGPSAPRTDPHSAAASPARRASCWSSSGSVQGSCSSRDGRASRNRTPASRGVRARKILLQSSGNNVMPRGRLDIDPLVGKGAAPFDGCFSNFGRWRWSHTTAVCASLRAGDRSEKRRPAWGESNSRLRGNKGRNPTLPSYRGYGPCHRPIMQDAKGNQAVRVRRWGVGPENCTGRTRTCTQPS